MNGNPHHVPGMGYAKNNPSPRPTSIESVACRTRCGEVELKITLTPKFLARPFRDALVEPFLKVHNKRATQPVSWEHVKCVKIDGFAVDALSDTTIAASLLTKEYVTVELLTSVPSSLFDALVEVAREFEPVTQDNYETPPPPPMTRKLIAIAQSAAEAVDAAGDDVADATETSAGGHVDEDTLRRSNNAFEAIAGGSPSVAGPQVRTALLSDDYVRSLCFPPQSPHNTTLEDKLRRMSMDRADSGSIEAAEFTRFFVALSAAACAPKSAAEEEPDPATGRKANGGSKDFLQQLMDDENCTVRRVR